MKTALHITASNSFETPIFLGAYEDYSPSDEDDLKDTSICYLPHETGRCRAYIEKWGFDASSRRCVKFTYGGCGGNANNFDTKEACEQRCLG